MKGSKIKAKKVDVMQLVEPSISDMSEQEIRKYLMDRFPVVDKSFRKVVEAETKDDSIKNGIKLKPIIEKKN